MREDLVAWYGRSEAVTSIGMAVDAVGDDWVRTTLDPSDGFRNPNGAINGGVLASFMDLAGGLLVGVTVEDEASATIELGIHFMRAAVDTPLVATASIKRRGRRFMFLSIDAVDANGRPCVSATGTWAIGRGSHPPGSGGAARHAASRADARPG